MSAEFVRILQCWQCKTMEEMPDYEGHVAYDSVLQTIDEKHGGQTENPHVRNLHRIAKKDWDNRAVRRETVEQMWAKETGFKPSYYDIKNTLTEDAGKCFNAHHRSIPCLDYRDSSKKLGNPAAQDRARLAKEMHNESIKHSAISVWLCNFCVIQTTVEFAQRKARGEE